MGRASTNIIPFCWPSKNDIYFYKGKSYSLPQHGFFRRSNDIQLIHKSDNKLSFSLKSSKATLEKYPFEFEFITSYEIEENKITIHHKVINTGKEKMYFSIGEHPAFNCSLTNPNENYSNCFLEFEKNETALTHLINDGLIGNETEIILQNQKILELHKNSFDKDALVIKKMNSKKATLVNKNEGKLVSLHYEGFPLLGIWSKPNAPFVCIEPWLGIADSVETTQKIEDKEGIILLEKGKEFNCSYSIEVHI